MKTWQEGLTPEDIEVEVRAKDGDVDWLIESITLTQDNQYTQVLKDLPSQVNGKNMIDLLYLKEITQGDYTVKISSFKQIEANQENDQYSIEIHNEKKESPKIKVQVQKFWRDKESNEISSPVQGIEVELYQDGKATGKTRVLEKASDWKAVFENLEAQRADGTKIEYSIKEKGEEQNIININQQKYKVNYTGNQEEGLLIINREMPSVPPTPPTGNKHLPNTGEKREMVWFGVIALLVGCYLYSRSQKIKSNEDVKS